MGDKAETAVGADWIRRAEEIVEARKQGPAGRMAGAFAARALYEEIDEELAKAKAKTERWRKIAALTGTLDWLFGATSVVALVSITAGVFLPEGMPGWKQFLWTFTAAVVLARAIRLGRERHEQR